MNNQGKTIAVRSTFDRALVVVPNGDLLVVCTGTAITFNHDGSISVVPPEQRVEFDGDGKRVPFEPASHWTFWADGRSAEMPHHRGCA